MSSGLVRSALRLATIGLAASALMAACGSAPSPSPSRDRAASSGPDVVMIIRHAEKPDGPDEGIDQHGREDGGSLTATGWERARRLVDLFAPVHGSPPRGLSRPGVIYAAGATDDGEGLRTRQTVAPLSAALGVPVHTDFGKGEEERLVKEVLGEPGTALISWQHSGIPDIVDSFGAVTPKPPKKWPDERYDLVWTLTRTADGWRFAQIPELLLPGDDPEAIPD
ncbi:histidine phosphatase family protein [Pseudonocardia sp. TRM90224]|uniref:histidine phosphatase family protein n=1 Tax=Pseudonocardia sp. TRM90224 TaxID=2812678 RepID=UPI001E29F7CF|nr:histidine phosphatase family protein [Pseudonocardia sp. TRM90224]